MLLEIEKLSDLLSKPAQGSSKIELEEVTDFAREGADKLRDLRYRAFIGSETSLIPSCFLFLQQVGPIDFNHPYTECKADAIKHVMRVVGNLVHTHDENRQKCVDKGATNLIKLILDSLLSSRAVARMKEPFLSCIQILLVVTYNLCADFAPAQFALADSGIFYALCQLVESTFTSNVHLCLAAIRLVEELCCCEKAKKLFPESLVVSICKPILEADDFFTNPQQADKDTMEVYIDIIVICSSVLESITDNVSPRQSAGWIFDEVSKRKDGISNNLFSSLLWFIRYSNPPVLDGDWDENDVDSPRKVWEQIKARIGRALVLSLSHIKEMGDVNKDPIIEVLISWLKETDVVEQRPDLVIVIGLSLGNLACDDLSCRRLVEDYGAILPLASSLNFWLPITTTSTGNEVVKKGRPGEQAQVLHALCGLARNLSVSEPSKSKIGRSGIPEGAIECLRPEFDMVTPLIGSALGLIRHLCRHNGIFFSTDLCI
ncbi:hypothetical protein BY996DRAFT_7694079 [Phakopsora pachyrhizi]|nr:hypothetical protein BY996DRAFT_7694079 [Phakopsora pachyrhizi]